MRRMHRQQACAIGQRHPELKRKRGEPEICPACRGLGYKGRTAIFEFLIIDDKLKQALPNLDLKAAFIVDPIGTRIELTEGLRGK